MGFLKLIGAVSAAEHERAIRPFRERLFDSEQKRIHWQGAANEFAAKYKAAITDLAAAQEEIAAYKEGAKALHRGIDDAAAEIKAKNGLVSSLTEKNVELVGRIETLKSEIAALRPDAQKWRDYLKRSRDRRSNKSPVKSVPALKSKRAA